MSCPVQDIGRFLSGKWQVVRLGLTGSPEQAMRFRGTACFSACRAGLLLEERGEAAVGAYKGEACQRTVFHFDGASAADVRFEDGRLFHQVDLATGAAVVEHDCPPDRYEGRYRVLAADRWLLGWRVAGPRKKYLIASRFTR